MIDWESLCQKYDQDDELGDFRSRFDFQEGDLIYLDGNSLGVRPTAVEEVIRNVVVEEWGRDLIGGWNKSWYEYNDFMGSKIAQLIGARPDEVILSDSTSINLFKLAVAALRSTPKRTTIVSDTLNFPSDLYVLQGITDLLGPQYTIDLVNSQDEISVTIDELKQKLNNQVGLVSLSHVCFKSSFMYDMLPVTKAVHDSGAYMLWDLSHSVGAVPIELNQAGVDLAVGCTYKYLNGGPGSLAFLYVRKDLQELLLNPIWAWFSQHEPFKFDLDYHPATGIKRYLTSTPPILSAKAIEPGIDLMIEAGMDRIREKSIKQSSFLLELFQQFLKPLGFSLGSPEQAIHRGSHLSIRHPQAYRICQALLHPPDGSPKVVPDFRAPDNIRLGITPLYTRFEDLYRAVVRIVEVVESGEWERVGREAGTVT